jgi:hypothetical protein
LPRDITRLLAREECRDMAHCFARSFSEIRKIDLLKKLVEKKRARAQSSRIEGPYRAVSTDRAVLDAAQCRCVQGARRNYPELFRVGATSV